jgi:hypothetical protein
MRPEGVNGLTVGGLLNLVAERRPDNALGTMLSSTRTGTCATRIGSSGTSRRVHTSADGGRPREAAVERYGMQTSVGDTAQITSRESPTSAGAACPVRASGCYHCVVLGDWGPACARDRTEGGLEWCLEASERGG